MTAKNAKLVMSAVVQAWTGMKSRNAGHVEARVRLYRLRRLWPENIDNQYLLTLVLIIGPLLIMELLDQFWWKLWLRG
jgi:hypothetical protein